MTAAMRFWAAVHSLKRIKFHHPHYERRPEEEIDKDIIQDAMNLPGAAEAVAVFAWEDESITIDWGQCGGEDDRQAVENGILVVMDDPRRNYIFKRPRSAEIA
jgi:hypothetical protein